MIPVYPSPYEHILSSRQFDVPYLETLFARADDIQKNPGIWSVALRGRIIATLFYEPSTRTRLSCESAVLRLGGSCISTENAKEFSSAIKGETLEDSIRIVSNYCDAIVLRHFDDDSSERAVTISGVPIVNAGSGKREHPTQALLDIYTIQQKFGRLTNLNIVVAGDLLRGRTGDSLVYLLSQFQGNSFHFVAPTGCAIKEEVRAYLTEHDISFDESEDIGSVVGKADVLYMTRIQKERLASEEDFQRASEAYLLTQELVGDMKQDAIILHPLPRNGEIPESIDTDPRAFYFKQAANGVLVRMALLTLLHKFQNT